MLAYAAQSTPRSDPARPRLLIPIVAGHLVVIALVMTARMEGARTVAPPPLVVENYRLTPPPPPPDPTPPRPVHKVDPAPAQTTVAPLVDIAPAPTFPTLPPSHDAVAPADGAGLIPTLDPPPVVLLLPHSIVRTAPRLDTAEALLRPPYPASKRDLGEEASLTLKLSIDERGRVTAVDPIGRADPAFLASARAHLIRAWRFEPATQDGTPVASTKTITLRFQLGDGEA